MLTIEQWKERTRAATGAPGAAGGCRTFTALPPRRRPAGRAGTPDSPPRTAVRRGAPRRTPRTLRPHCRDAGGASARARSERTPPARRSATIGTCSSQRPSSRCASRSRATSVAWRSSHSPRRRSTTRGARCTRCTGGCSWAPAGARGACSVRGASRRAALVISGRAAAPGAGEPRGDRWSPAKHVAVASTVQRR